MCYAVGVSCRGLRNKENGKKLFLSRRVVTETREFDGGVLVDENGIISGIYTRKSAENLLHNDGTLQVILEICHILNNVVGTNN